MAKTRSATTFKYSRVTLDRSETTKLTLDIPPWEVAVLAAVNGDDRVAVIGETPVNRDLPDPGFEFDRLSGKYKSDPKSGRDYVALVYGEGGAGVQALAKAIAKARSVAAVPPVQTPEYSANDDPLTGLFDDAPEMGGGAVEITE